MSGAIYLDSGDEAEFAHSSAYNSATTSRRGWVPSILPRSRSHKPGSFSSEEESGTETGPFVQFDVENSDDESPFLPPSRVQDPYPVRSTTIETDDPSATRQSVFRSWLNKLTSFLSRNAATPTRHTPTITTTPTTTVPPQTTAQVLPDFTTTTTTAPVRKPIWEILDGENVNLTERGWQSVIQRTMGSRHPSLQNSFGGTNHPGPSFYPNFSQNQPPWDATNPSQFSQRDQPTMENLIRYHMMMQMRQDDGDYETEDGLGFRSGMRYVPSSVFTHPSVASNGLGGSRRIVRLPDGRYGPSAFGQFTESSQLARRDGSK